MAITTVRLDLEEAEVLAELAAPRQKSGVLRQPNGSVDSDGLLPDDFARSVEFNTTALDRD